MASNRTEQVFSSTAATYDAARAKLIPCFTAFYTAAVAALPEHTNQVLDLGAGTGLLSAFVRERFPDAYLHLMDSSEPMLEQAKTRFQRDQETTFQLADYTVAIEPRHYHAIVSALSIHHLPDELKKQVYMRAFAALDPGGVFVNAEQILQPTPELESNAKEHWLEEVKVLGATEQQIKDSLLRQTEDRCATISDQLDWLREAGFSDARCTFEQGRFAVLTGTRQV